MNQNNVNFSEAIVQTLELPELKEKSCYADVLRLDKIHPVISGNKWFKLKYHLEDARKNGYKTLLTFGGAYSNHIIAAALSAREANFNSIGIIRGEEPKQLSHTLKAASDYGMRLKFISREQFKKINEQEIQDILINEFGSFYQIPEGGKSSEGRRGCKEILHLTDFSKYTHILSAIGTGTTYLGLVNSSELKQQVIGIPVLKGMNDLLSEYYDLIENPEKRQYCKIFYEYYFGGYAKKTPELIGFMNSFYRQTAIPTDFIYTGKLMYAFIDLLKKNFFAPGSKLLIIHSGGLQGNLSLPENTLEF
jgi:1-aminocyclopropane-1-carboxylate deaminase